MVEDNSPSPRDATADALSDTGATSIDGRVTTRINYSVAGAGDRPRYDVDYTFRGVPRARLERLTRAQVQQAIGERNLARIENSSPKGSLTGDTLSYHRGLSPRRVAEMESERQTPAQTTATVPASLPPTSTRSDETPVPPLARPGPASSRTTDVAEQGPAGDTAAATARTSDSRSAKAGVSGTARPVEASATPEPERAAERDAASASTPEPPAESRPGAASAQAEAASGEATAARTEDVAERNVLEPEVIEREEALARVARARQAERATRSSARAEHADAPVDQSRSGEALTIEPISEEERTRREQIRKELANEFRVKGERYRFKEGREGESTGTLAFRDGGNRLATGSNDPRAAKAIAKMADAKGWGAVKVSGSEDFRRNAFIEATARGIEVRGYEPTEQDLEAVAKRSLERLPNAAERVTEERVAAAEPRREDERPQEASGAATDVAKRSVAASPKAAHKDHAAPLSGQLVDHGPAPYQHDPSEKPSYRAKVETARGEREVWGVDLGRAIAESGAERGDGVQLRRTERTAVTVDANVKDAGGRVVGTERVAATRNGWDVTVVERRKMLDAVADSHAERVAKTPADYKTLRDALARRLDREAAKGTLPDPPPIYDISAPPIAAANVRAPERAAQQERDR